tara:strand:+ start:382 stop:567 length:186 start_codon:yes stop_codon:yes gene_type:complete
VATNSRNQSGRDYQSWGEAQRQQNEEKRDHQERDRSEDKAKDYLRNPPSASWAEAVYKTNR